MLRLHKHQMPSAAVPVLCMVDCLPFLSHRAGVSTTWKGGFCPVDFAAKETGSVFREEAVSGRGVGGGTNQRQANA